MVQITEKNYAHIMQTEVEPALAAIREEGFFDARDGLRIHYEMYVHPEARGGVVISHGFTESAEKFREVAYRMYAQRLSVFAVDHRGHGQSDRLILPEFLTHVDNFADYVDDFERFVDQVVLPRSCGKPLVLFGHSMGGAIAALMLMRRSEVFSRAVLNAPMIQPLTKGIPFRIAQVMGRVLCAVGMGKRLMFGFCDGFDPQENFETGCDTSRARFEYYLEKRRRMPHLQNMSPTIGWVRNAMDVTDVLLSRKNASAIACPVLLLQAETDGSVVNEAEDKFIALVPQGRLVQVPGSKHEIYASTDDVLEGYYQMLFDFIGEATE